MLSAITLFAIKFSEAYNDFSTDLLHILIKESTIYLLK